MITKCSMLWIIGFLLIIYSCNKESQENTEGDLQDLTEVRVAAYNVEVGRNATAVEIGNALSRYNLDVVGFSEVPGGSWTRDVAKVLGMDYVIVGKYSTAGHDDKYKSIASKTPLYDFHEFLMTDTLHTVTSAKTKIGEKEITFHSVHFPFGWRDQAHIDETTAKISSFVNHLREQQPEEISIVIGDFNFIPSTADTENMYHEMFKEAGLDFSWGDLGIDPSIQNTHNAFEPGDEGNGNVIDHIMYNPSKAEAIDGEIIHLQPPLSDHKPVWALIRLKPDEK